MKSLEEELPVASDNGDEVGGDELSSKDGAVGLGMFDVGAVVSVPFLSVIISDGTGVGPSSVVLLTGVRVGAKVARVVFGKSMVAFESQIDTFVGPNTKTGIGAEAKGT